MLPYQVVVVNLESDTLRFHSGGSCWDLFPYDTLQFPMRKYLGDNLFGQACVIDYEGKSYWVELYGSHFPGEGIVQEGTISSNIWVSY